MKRLMSVEEAKDVLQDRSRLKKKVFACPFIGEDA